MAKNPFTLPKMPGMKVYSDKNLNKQMKLKSDKEFTNPPTSLTPYPSGESLNPDEKKARFRRLAGILGGLHKK